MSWRASLAGAAFAFVLATPAAAGEKGGGTEGVKVHGRWTIEVRNSDGSLVSHHEFENDLIRTGGGSILSLLLARQAAPGYWTVKLFEGNPNSGGPCLSSTTPVPCTLDEPGTDFARSHSTNLVLDAPETGPNTRSVVLSGSVAAQRDGIIDGVVSVLQRCPAAASPSPQCFGADHNFSLARPPAVDVKTGQIIQVKVVFSFS